MSPKLPINTIVNTFWTTLHISLEKESVSPYGGTFNFKVLNFHFENFCCCEFKARFLRTTELCLPLREYLKRKIYPIEVKFSESVVLSKDKRRT